MAAASWFAGIGRIAGDRAEGLVEQVVTEQRAVAAQRRGDASVRVGLRGTQIRIVVQVGEGGLDGRLEVIGEPVVGVGLERQAVGARGPGGDAVVPEGRAEDVLVPVDEHQHSVPVGPAQHPVEVPQVGGVVPAPLRLHLLPLDVEPQQGEPFGGEAGDAPLRDGVGLAEVEAAQGEDSPLPVGEPSAAVRRADGAGGRGDRLRLVLCCRRRLREEDRTEGEEDGEQGDDGATQTHVASEEGGRRVARGRTGTPHPGARGGGRQEGGGAGPGPRGPGRLVITCRASCPSR